MNPRSLAALPRVGLCLAALGLAALASCGGDEAAPNEQQPRQRPGAAAAQPRPDRAKPRPTKPKKAVAMVSAAEAQARLDALEAEPDTTAAADAFLEWVEEKPRRVAPQTYRLAARLLMVRDGEQDAKRVLETAIRAHPSSDPLQSALSQAIDAVRAKARAEAESE